MNEFSLTGLLTDLQSPEKTSKNTALVHVLNENSRDSIFFNVIFKNLIKSPLFFMHILHLCARYMNEKIIDYYSSVYCNKKSLFKIFF